MKCEMNLSAVYFVTSAARPAIMFENSVSGVQVDISPVPISYRNGETIEHNYSCIVHWPAAVLSDEQQCTPYLESAVEQMIWTDDEQMIQLSFKIMKQPVMDTADRAYFTVIITIPELHDAGPQGQALN